MIKFWIANRPVPGADLDQYDYEWGIVHPSLMALTLPSVSAFQRYAQNRSVDGYDPSLLIVPSPPENWYGISEHSVKDFEGLLESLSDEYRRRMSAHKFGDDAFVLELTSSEVRYGQDEPFEGRGGVKLVTFLRKRPELSQLEFVERWRGGHASVLLDVAAHRRPLVKRYVQNPQLSLDSALFVGTLFEAGGAQTYAGIEEMWFNDLEDLQTFGRDPQVRGPIHESLSNIVEIERSFSMVVVERILFDRRIHGSPVPAILDPNSFESRLVASEPLPGHWRSVQPIRDDKVAPTSSP